MKRFFQKIADWEKWSYDVIYLPVDIFWLWYAIRARAFWFFTPVNPSLVFAGFEGGSKKEMYDQLPRWSYPTTIYAEPGKKIEEVRVAIEAAGLHFPLVAKPDTGMGGVLFKIIHNEEKLRIYHEKVGELYVLQEYVDEWPEFSVFHIRYPGEKKGIVTGLILKDYLHVTGDGSKTLAELIASNPVANYRKEELQKRHRDNWQKIIPGNEKYILNLAGNHSSGAKFINLNHEIDAQLSEVFDRISNETGQFHFGRYDLKCPSLGDLKAGKNIKILEFNGAGAAITHVFDRNMSYVAALKEIVRHWRHLYRIGRINHKKGVPYWKFMKGYRFIQNAKKNFRRMKKIDEELL